MKKIFCILMLCISFNAYSYSPFWAGLGTTTRNVGTAQSDETGSTVKFKFNPTILVGASIPFWTAGFYLAPAVGFGKHSNEDDANRTEIILQYHVAQQLVSNFLLHYGFSNVITKVSGKGGSVTLNNGNSTATFYTPKESKTSYMASIDLGGEFVLTNDFGARIQLSADRFLSSEQRRFSHLITVNYYF